MSKLSIVIPCYRSAGTISGVVDELTRVMQTLPEWDYRIIMVSDSSPDNVYEVICDLCKADPEHLTGVELARNFGQNSALMAGYHAADGDVVLSMDDDGQAPVEALPEMLKALDTADVVYGSYACKKHHFFRNLGSRFNDWMMCMLLGKPRGLQITSFMAARRFIINEMLRADNPYPILDGLVLRSTRNIVNIPVNHRAREQGESGYTVTKLVMLWLNGVIAFSIVPLRLASACGFFCSLAGGLYGIWIIIQHLLDPSVPQGYSSIMAVLLFVGGLLMLMLGVIGEYVGRISLCTNRCPQFVIRRRTGSD